MKERKTPAKAAIHATSTRTSTHARVPRKARSLAKPADAFHHGDLAEALIVTTLAMIEESGHESLTLRKLAERLGVTQPALYSHFASKNALLFSAVMRGLADFEDAMVAGLESESDPYAAVAACARAYVRFAHARRGWFRLFATRSTMETLRPTQAVQPERSHSRASMRSTLAQIVPPGDPALDDVYRSMWGLAHGLSGLVVERLFQLVETDEERLAAADAAIEIAVDALRARYGPAR